MKKHSLVYLSVIALILVSACLGFSAYSQIQSTSQKGPASMHATGPFDVKLTPQDDKIDPALGRMTIDKQYHGDLEATGKGQMLTGGTDVKTSGVYVAVEKITGTLKGRKGTFLLYHQGIMDRGKPQLSINVAPDSGTGELAGISGKMNIIIAEGGKHSYDFEYTLPEAN
jgi:Protein of unknown function (DUF3224)